MKSRVPGETTPRTDSYDPRIENGQSLRQESYQGEFVHYYEFALNLYGVYRTAAPAGTL